MRRRTNLHESGSNSIAREKRKFDGSDITGAWGFKRDKRKRKKKETKQRKKKTHTWASNILTNSSVSSLCIKFLKRQEDCPPPSQLDTFPKSKPRRRAFLLVKTHWLLQWIALHEIHHSKISHPHVPSSCSCILLFIVGIPFLILYFTTTAAAQSDPAPRHLSIVSIAAHPIPYHHPPTPSPRTSFFPHGQPPPLFHPNPKPPETLPKDPPSSLNRQIRTSTTAQTLSHPQTNTTLRFAIRFRPHTPTNFITHAPKHATRETERSDMQSDSHDYWHQAQELGFDAKQLECNAEPLPFWRWYVSFLVYVCVSSSQLARAFEISA